MAAKFDKDTLIKHRFWIMLGTTGLLVFICWLVLVFSSSGAAEKKKFNDTLESVKKLEQSKPKNKKWIDPWVEYGDKFTAQKDGVWKQGWETQLDMYTWPSRDKARFDKILWYDQDVGPDSIEARKTFGKTLYVSQFDGLEKLVRPVEFNGGDAGFKTIMGPASSGKGGGGPLPGGPMMPGGSPGGKMKGFGGPGGEGGGFPGSSPSSSSSNASFDSVFASYDQTPPTMEEIWLAQEDFWVKRELLKIVRAALDEYAIFKPVEIKDEPMPEGNYLSRHRFRNPSWEITLLIEKAKEKGAMVTAISPHSTIKNVSATKRTQLVANGRTGKGLKFELSQKGPGVPLVIEGEPVPYGASVEFKKATFVDSIDFANPFILKQDLEWATSPIRRIDDLRTAKNSHRLAAKGLTFNPQLYKEPEKQEVVETKSEMPNMPGMPPGSNGPPSVLGAGAGTPATPLGFERDRYILVNDQCRHLPVALVLEVDQAAVNDVLIAISNSPLKIQVAQVHLLHVHDSGPVTAGGDLASSGPGPDRGGFPEGSAGGVGKRPGSPPPSQVGPKFPGGSFPGAPGGVPGNASLTEEAAEDNNLFELTVYGVAILYERPGKEERKDNKEADKPGAPK
jgi:hypothetical protein